MSNPSSGRLTHGQKLFGVHQIPVPFTRIMDEAVTTADPLVGQALTEIEPKDRQASEVTVLGPIDLSSYWLGPIAGEHNIPLPKVLTALTPEYEQGGGANSYSESATSSETGWTGVGLSLSGSAQASAYNIPKLLPVIQEVWGDPLPVNHYYYFGQAFDISTILSKLSAKLGETVSQWPIFKPESLHFVLLGEKSNASARVSLQGSVSSGPNGSSSSLSEGEGAGLEISPSVELMDIPPTLHTGITLSISTSPSFAAAASISATGAISGAPSVASTAEANSVIAPSIVTATSPTALPTSGLYLYATDVEPSETFGWFYVHVIIFDFATIA